MMNKLLFLVLIIAILAGVACGSVRTRDVVAEPELTIHNVAPGETLWDIAKLYSPKADPRKVVYEIRCANNLKSALIYPGQKLIVAVGMKGR